MLNENKYNIISATNRKSGKEIPLHEPVFLIRASDKHSFALLAHYMGMCRDRDHADAVFKTSVNFHNWQNNNRESVKEPD